MVDNCCDRETEKLLQEFSESLDDKALMFRSDVNLGVVKALNRGLEKGEAKYLCVIKNTTMVGPGWLEPLIEFAEQKEEAGLIAPRLLLKGEEKKREKHDVTEVLHGSFSAMLIKKTLYDAIKGFDEEMDGGMWCLKDYSRRACRAGFYTFLMNRSDVRYEEDVQFGSETRRQENLQKTIEEFRRRWGDDSSYCLLMPKKMDADLLRSRLESLLPASRQGFFFHVIVPSRLYKDMVKSGHDALHEWIRLYPLPLFYTAANIRKLISRIVSESPETGVVAGIDGMSCKGVDLLPFADLERRIEDATDRRN